MLRGLKKNCNFVQTDLKRNVVILPSPLPPYRGVFLHLNCEWGMLFLRKRNRSRTINVVYLLEKFLRQLVQVYHVYFTMVDTFDIKYMFQLFY